MKIFSNEDIRNIEKITLENNNITSIELIENAAVSITAEITSRWLPSMRVLVLAGWGNNGADALATARLLAEQGYSPEVYLFNIQDKLSAEGRVFRERLLECGDAVTLYEITGREPFSWPEPEKESLIIDGLFGSGLNRPLPASFRTLVQNINLSEATVASIDVPSGLFSGWNEGMSTENMVHATLTLALTSPRLPFFLEDYAHVVGEWKVLDIGLDLNAMRDAPYTFFLVQRNTVRPYLPPRNPFSSKANYGHAEICAGSEGMIGAAVLTAEGALRSGAGKVTVRSPRCGLDILQTAQPAALCNPDSHPRYLTSIPVEEKYNAVAVGPGIGTAEDTIDALESFLKAKFAKSQPVILDADALNCIAKRPILLDYLPLLSIITPHDGEFDRLFGEQPSHEARLRKAIEMSYLHKILIILKGHFTAIVRPDQKVLFNASGTPAMAKGGSGDVLTGVLVSLMAQGYKPEEAAFIGTYIHGVAGEIAASEHSEYGVTARDIAYNIGRAIASITE